MNENQLIVGHQLHTDALFNFRINLKSIRTCIHFGCRFNIQTFITALCIVTNLSLHITSNGRAFTLIDVLTFSCLFIFRISQWTFSGMFEKKKKKKNYFQDRTTENDERDKENSTYSIPFVESSSLTQVFLSSNNLYPSLHLHTYDSSVASHFCEHKLSNLVQISVYIFKVHTKHSSQIILLLKCQKKKTKRNFKHTLIILQNKRITAFHFGTAIIIRIIERNSI